MPTFLSVWGTIQLYLLHAKGSKKRQMAIIAGHVRGDKFYETYVHGLLPSRVCVNMCVCVRTHSHSELS